MRKIILAGAIILAAPSASAQDFGNILKGIFGSSPKSSTSNKTATPSSALSNSEIQSGLKEALILGAQAVGSQLSKPDGYFGDNDIRIPLPGRLAQVQSQLSRIGMSGPLDDLQMKLNRAAESAAPQAADLVVDAVRSLTIEDGMALLNGGDTAATTLLRTKTESNLQALLKPYMQSALVDSGALNGVDSLSARYGLTSVTDDLKSQLVDSAVQEGLDGLFFYLAKEEQDIRKNPVKRTTDLLRKVFGG